ncbi:MAG: glutamate mutase L [Clostridia bacterium]
MNWILVDIGSVQTKVTLVNKNEIWDLLASAKSETTIETNEKTALNGVKKLIDEVLNETGKTIEDVDKVLIGSTAGGGLQMVVAGVVRTMTAESANRAALGSGAVVVDIVNGGSPVRQPERLAQFKNSKPDIILLAGGTEGGNEKQVLGLAETINAAKPQTRWEDEYSSVVFAGNSEVREDVLNFLDSKIDVKIAENIRPELEYEQIETINETIQDLYIKKVVKNVSGFNELGELYNCEIQPLVPNMKRFVDKYSVHNNINTLIFDVGGFTTDVYSSIEYIRREYKRAIKDGGEKINTGVGVVKERKSFVSVSADAGMNYSAPRLLEKVGLSKIINWTEGMNEKQMLNSSFKRMTHPLDKDIYNDGLNRALTAGALEIGFVEHQEIASKLHGVGIVRSMNETFTQEATSEGTLAEWEAFDKVILTGGAISQFDYKGIIQIFNDSLQPNGLINLAIDKEDYLSQLVLNDNLDESYLELIDNQLLNVATIIAPKVIDALLIRNIATITLESENETKTFDLIKNEIEFVNIKGNKVKVTISPHKKVDFGAGFGKPIKREIDNSIYGFILDGRRPISDEFSKINIDEWYGKDFNHLKRGGVSE